MAACTIFEEDEVCIPTSTGGFKYGLVVQSSEYISSDEEEDDYEDRVQKGTVKVAWHPSGDETVVAENKLILTDRSLMPGDVVRRHIAEKDSQRGFVETILTKCHVKILGTEQWIYNVDVANISTMQEWDTESDVTLDSWVGQLYEVREDVTVRFPDGGRCIIKDAGMSNLEDYNDKRSDHSEFVMRNFYPGQELYGQLEDYEQAEWIHATPMRGPASVGGRALYTVPVFVEKVEVTGVDVRWLCKGFTRVGSEKDALEAPERHLEGDILKCLKVIDCFRHCHHQIGDKGYYVVKETDTVLRNTSPRQHYIPDIIQKKSSDNITVIGTRKDGFVVARKDKEKEEKKTNEAGDGLVENGIENTATDENHIGCIVDNDTEENDGDDEFEDGDVDDDDNDDGNLAHTGSHSSPGVRHRNRKRSFLKSLKSTKKLRSRQPKKKLKLPERIVSPGDKVPVEIWYTFSTCQVMWQDGTTEEDIPSPELLPIHHLDESEYFPGDFVIDAKGSPGTDYGVIVSCDHKERTCMVKWLKPYFPGKSQRPEEVETTEVSVYDIKDHPDYKYRPGNTVIRVGGFEGTTEELEAVGQVYKLDADGSVHIWWPSNTISKSYPQDLFLITDDMSGVNSSDDWSETDEDDDTSESSDVSWETEGEESADSEGESEEETKKENQSKPVWACDDKKKEDLDESLRRLQAAISGLLDIFLNFYGPFFKNSKQIFQDILSIFKRCKEIEKLMKTSFFNEPEISDLISEIKEELRKVNTTKLAKHVVSLYKYRNASHYNIESETKIVEDTVKDKDKLHSDADSNVDQTVTELKSNDTLESNTSSSIPNSEPETGSVNNHNSELESGASVNLHSNEVASGTATDLQGSRSGLAAARATAIGDRDAISEDESTRQKLQKALIDYGTHIDDPILQIIFDTQLHLAVANSARRKVEKQYASDESSKTCESSENFESKRTENSQTEIAKSDKKAISDTDVADIVESAVLLVCSGGQDSLEVAALKDSAKRKVEEMCCQALGDSLGTQTSGLNTTHIHIHSTEVPSSPNNESHSDSVINSQEKAKSDTVNQSGVSAEKLGLPSSHKTLCIRVCKALNTRLYHIQQEMNRKWLAYKFGCDESASDVELFEKMQAKMIESHDKHGKPLLLSEIEKNIPEEKTETKIESGDKSNEAADTEISQKPDNKDFNMGSLGPDETANSGAENGAFHNEQVSSGFELCSSVHSSHWFKFQEQKPTNQKAFLSAVRKELSLLQSSLPEGIMVKAFEDRMDLFAVMIAGPAKTPYEDGLFAFDVQLPANFPSSPPVFHYLSYCNERLNPNLYEDGKVCVSLLGTWSGKGSEMWTSKSSLLQVLVSIQGLILVSEPYFNEAGYEKQRGTQHGQENSRMYNEMAILKLVQSMTKMALAPPSMFVQETRDHLNKRGKRMIERLESWIELSYSQKNLSEPDTKSQSGDMSSSQESHDQNCASDKEHVVSSNSANTVSPEFPLLPASKGFCLTVKKHLETFKNVLKEHIWRKDMPDH